MGVLCFGVFVFWGVMDLLSGESLLWRIPELILGKKKPRVERGFLA